MLDHPTGAGSEGGFRLDFDPGVPLKFHGSNISSDGGLLLFRELDETLGLHDRAGPSLRDTRTGKRGSQLCRPVAPIHFWATGRLPGCECGSIGS